MKEEGFDTEGGVKPPASRGTRRHSASFKKKKFPLLFPFENGAEARRHELVNSLHFKEGFIWANLFASGFPLQSFLRQKWFIAPLQPLALLLPSSQPAISLTINSTICSLVNLKMPVEFEMIKELRLPRPFLKALRVLRGQIIHPKIAKKTG